MWYSAKLLFETCVGDGKGTLRDERIYLLKATNDDEATTKANALGMAEQTEYLNYLNEVVRWRFVALLDIQDLSDQDVHDGMEVYSVLSEKR